MQLHWSTARYAPWQEGPLLQGLADQVLDGAVAELGVSNIGPKRLRRIQGDLAARGVPLRSLQVQLSLLAPEPIRPGGLVDVCRELGVELIAYSPLALGLLTRMPGKEPSLPSGPRRWLFRRLWSDLQPLLGAMAEIAARRDASPAAVALNWCRAHGALPIAGLRTVAQADAAGDALAWGLEEGERERLDQLALALPSGARMPANPFQSA